MKVADILRAGKARIERMGWAQGNGAMPPRVGCCALTAIAGPNGDYHFNAVETFERANGITLEVPIYDWNDDPARTKEEVLAAFDKAITLAEQENA